MRHRRHTGRPLWRNRDFVLLQTGQLLSALGTHTATLAYPLLVLALTGSPAQAGLVGFARVLPMALFGFLAGAAADRWNRKWLMIGSDALRVAALGTLGGAIAAGEAGFWLVAVVAFVEGVGGAVFAAAQTGALRSVVPAPQLPDAAAVQTARHSVVFLAGPPLGGALFALGRAVPFVVDAVSYLFSSIALLLMRTRFQEERERDTAPLRTRVAEGFRYLWERPFIRTPALLFGVAGFVMPGLLLALIVIAEREGLTSTEIGFLTATFGATLLLGSALSPLVRRRLSVRAIVWLEMWTWTLCALFLVWPSVYVLAFSILPMALVIPSTDAVVHGYRIATTPDRLIGRVDAAAHNIAQLASPVGPLVAGVLLSEVSERATVAVFAAGALVLALWGTLSPSIRNAPSLDELGREPPPEPPTLGLDPEG